MEEQTLQQRHTRTSVTSRASAPSPESAGSEVSEGVAATKAKKGLSFWVAGFFIVAQLGGAGFVSLPAAIGNTGWLGVPMMVLFCVIVGFSATRLGICYNILEERWPECYKEPARQPYMEIAQRAMGDWGRKIALVCVVVSQFGGTAVFIILIAQMTNTIIPAISTCGWVLIVGFSLIPIVLFGSPKDFWIGPMLAVVSTVIACIVIVVQALLDDRKNYPPLQHSNPTASSFALGYGAILFAFGGTSVFPTIQNDMKDRSEFWKSIILGFSCVLLMYLPISIIGYTVYGTNVDSNILFSIPQGLMVQIAMGLQIVNLYFSFVIGFSTVALAFEDIFSVPAKFGVWRVICRTVLVMMQIVICLAFPDFSLILNLIGASTMTACAFILPPIMYYKLCLTGEKHTEKEIPLWMKVAFCEIVILGVTGGLFATVSAVYEMFNSPFSASCIKAF